MYFMKRVSALFFVLLSLVVAASAQKLGKTEKVGTGVYEIVYNAKDDSLYVAAIGKRGEPTTANVYKLDPKTLAVKGTINTGDAPAFGLGLNRKTQTLYTSNTRNNSVHAIDLKTGKIVATINHGKDKSHTRELVADEKNNKIYVSNMTDIWVIDGATNKFSHLIEGVGEGVTGLAIDVDAGRLYTTNMTKNTVTVVDLKTGKVAKTFDSGGKNAINVAIDTKGKRLFVAHQESGTLAVLTTEGEVIKSIPTGDGALGVAYNPAKNLVYVSNRRAGTTSIIDAKTYTKVSDLQTGSFPQTIAFDEKSGTVWVSNKAKSGPRPQPGQPAPPPVEDPTGDVVTIIAPK